MSAENTKFIQTNSPDGGFLQSSHWRAFQKVAGRKTFFIEVENFVASIIEHQLPVVGKYFYVPRGPIFQSEMLKLPLGKMLELAQENGAGWIRIDPANAVALKSLRANIDLKIVKAPHDMQPKEIFVINIAKSEAEILAEMKAKTRYNIRLAEKKGVQIRVSRASVDVEKFCELVAVTAKRDGITAHPQAYYKKMVATIPPEHLQIYLAEFEGKIIAANLILFFGEIATYLHGASDNEHRNVMAPYLLQWQAIIDAKEKGCTHYDFGGVKTQIANRVSHIDSRSTIHDTRSWAGITKFKTGFAQNAQPLEFPGSYDIVIDPLRYMIYRGIQKIKSYIK